MRGLSLVAASGGHSSSRCAGLSLSRPLLLRSTGSTRAGSVIVAHGPSCSVACGIFPDQGYEPVSPAFAGRLSTTAPPGKPRNPLLISLPWQRQSVPKTGSINGRLTAGQTFRPELRSAPRKGNELFIWETQALLIDHGDLEY